MLSVTLSIMGNPEQVAILRQGVDAWNAWIRQGFMSSQQVYPDLSEMDISGMSLTGADLSWAKLGQANLGGADLTNAVLFGTHFGGANLSRARFCGASMLECNLGGANLTGADLRSAKLRGATIVDTMFADTDLREAEISECIHKGPSTIDHRTFIKSPNLPLAFMRGCGLPDLLIEYFPSILSSAVKFYSCFISHSTSDTEFAARIHADLQSGGVRCWFAEHDVQGGKKLYEQIQSAIRVHDKLLLILSEASMSSEWVKTEIAEARKREIAEKRRVLFPVTLVSFERVVRQWECFDADTGKDSAREIREFFIPDFSNWKNDTDYKNSFARLLKDLRAERSSE
jgi:uncharacterized protein YjbI with pentapeptide repeats